MAEQYAVLGPPGRRYGPALRRGLTRCSKTSEQIATSTGPRSSRSSRSEVAASELDVAGAEDLRETLSDIHGDTALGLDLVEEIGAPAPSSTTA